MEEQKTISYEEMIGHLVEEYKDNPYQFLQTLMLFTYTGQKNAFTALWSFVDGFANAIFEEEDDKICFRNIADVMNIGCGVIFYKQETGEINVPDQQEDFQEGRDFVTIDEEETKH